MPRVVVENQPVGFTNIPGGPGRQISEFSRNTVLVARNCDVGAIIDMTRPVPNKLVSEGCRVGQQFGSASAGGAGMASISARLGDALADLGLDMASGAVFNVSSNRVGQQVVGSGRVPSGSTTRVYGNVVDRQVITALPAGNFLDASIEIADFGARIATQNTSLSMDSSTVRLWPIADDMYDTRFVVVADGAKGFLRIHPVDKPEKTVVFSEADIGRINFLEASETTFERSRVLILFKTPQPWPFYQSGFRTPFLVVYCRVNDVTITPPQREEVEEYVETLKRSFIDEQSFVVADDDEEEKDEAGESQSAKKRKTLNGDSVKTGASTSSIVVEEAVEVPAAVSDEIQQDVREAGVEKIQNLLVENINNAIGDLFTVLCKAFESVKSHYIDPEPTDGTEVFFAEFDKGGTPFHCVSSKDNEILLTLEAAILCRKQLFTDLTDMATVVFHRQTRPQGELRSFKPVMIFFVPRDDAPIVCFESFEVTAAESLLLYLQNLDTFPVVYTEKNTRKINRDELDPLRLLVATDVEAICEGTPPSNDAQRCLVELEMKIPEDEQTPNDNDDPNDDDWDGSASNASEDDDEESEDA